MRGSPGLGLVMMLLGGGVLIFNRPMAKAALDWQLRVRKVFIFPGRPSTERGMRFLYRIAGLGLLVLGLLVVSGVIE